MDKKPKILIVDDKPQNLLALRTVLRDLNIELIEATSGNEALKHTLHHNFALALLDIQMPEMDGYELAGILRGEEKTAQMPFIFISAVYTDNLNVFKGYEKGAFSFITKPFHPEILINKVKFFIDKHQQEIALIKLNEDLRLKNEALDEINKELESFSYSVSHDLKAPLRSIHGYSQILKEDHGDTLNNEGKEVLNIIAENAVRMGKLIDSLLNFSRMGRKGMTETDIDMDLLVSRIVEEINALKSEKTSTWKVLPLKPAKGDLELLRQVLFNLISNAVKYSSKTEQAVIEIGCMPDNNMNIYYVKDNGAGFNMEYKDKLFGVFQRLHKASEFDGIGIGLAIVHRIVTRHGGQVWAEGEENKGATFYFSLPA